MSHAELAKELRDLFRTRSCDLGQWQRIWRGSGAASGVIDDMSDEQLRQVIEQVRRMPQVRRSA